jgi:hypothetical protein
VRLLIQRLAATGYAALVRVERADREILVAGLLEAVAAEVVTLPGYQMLFWWYVAGVMTEVRHVCNVRHGAKNGT